MTSTLDSEVFRQDAGEQWPSSSRPGASSSLRVWTVHDEESTEDFVTVICCFVFLRFHNKCWPMGLFFWPLPTGAQHGRPSAGSRPSVFARGGREAGQAADRTGGSPSRERDREATLVKHSDCCSGAFISGVFVADRKSVV